MLSSKFGIEIEFTGITRSKAADVVSNYLGGEVSLAGDYYDTHIIKAPDGRTWKVMFDSSITRRHRINGTNISCSSLYACELVSPILTYREDIGALQDIVRRLRKAGGLTNNSCGIHIHLDGSPHTPRSIRNFINLIASRNDLFYKALQIEDERMRYCKKMDAYLVERMNQKKPRTFAQLEEIWYAGYGGNRNGHYHDSRYHFLNLHCFFHGNHTIELRGFNSALHAGKVRASAGSMFPTKPIQTLFTGHIGATAESAISADSYLHLFGIRVMNTLASRTITSVQVKRRQKHVVRRHYRHTERCHG